MALPTIIEGASRTSNILSNQQVVDMADKIYLLEPNAAPLYVLVSKLNKRVAINTTFNWIEDELNPSWTTAAASALSSALCLTASDDIFTKYDLVKVPSTGEVVLVTSKATCYITVSRSVGATNCATVASAADLVIIGSAFAEGSSAADLGTMTTKTAVKTNYLQIFRKSVEISKTLANSELYGGDDRSYQRKKKGIELMRDLERAFLFGEASNDSSTPRRTTGGAIEFISTNETAAGGTLTETEFEAFLRVVFRYGSNTRYLFSAPIVLSVISMWAQGKLQMFPKDKTYGIAISQYVSPHGTLNLVKETMLENTGGPSGGVLSTSNYGGYALALELEELSYRYLQNRDVQFETEIQDPGDDFYKDQYICEVGMEFHQERKHAELTGVTG